VTRLLKRIGWVGAGLLLLNEATGVAVAGALVASGQAHHAVQGVADVITQTALKVMQ
jgi:hypothetical protein